MNKLAFALYIITILAGVYAIVVMYRREGPKPAAGVRRMGRWRSARPRSPNVWNK
jgi:hypothetical protein